jgi:hypothetical protein
MGATGSALEVTHLYLGDGGDSEGDIEDNDLKPNTQYFSRKNSVRLNKKKYKKIRIVIFFFQILRIPIPPRASNRMLGANIQVLAT